MAQNLFGGTTAKNFAIQGHPPIHSFEYVMAGGGYVDRPSYTPQNSWNQGAATAPVPRAYEMSNSDLEAIQRWLANLSSNVKYASQARGEGALPQSEVALWNDFWKRWLVFLGKISAAQKSLKDEAMAARVLASTSPADWPSRTLHKTAQGSLAIMLPENKRELDVLAGGARQLYDRFRLLGLGHVAMPYVGELAALLRSLPGELSLTDMVKVLRDGMRAGSRLLDGRASWGSWPKTGSAPALRDAISAADKLANKIEEVSKTPPGQGLRDTTTPVYQYFARVLAKIYVAASDLYGVAEPEHKPEGSTHRPEGATASIAWLMAAAGAGYLGWKWLADKVPGATAPFSDLGYHPQQESETKPWDSTNKD
jgi:hypothetical protein